MRPTYVAVIGLATLACRSDAPREEAAPVSVIEVHDGSAVTTIPLADTDLWQWCDDGVTAIVARSDSAFVVGACAQRNEQTFELSRGTDGRAVVTLSRRADHVVVSRAQPVRSLEIRATTRPHPVSLTVAVHGRAPVSLDETALLALLPPHQRRDGVPLRAILDKVGVTTPHTITIRGESTYNVDPASLATHQLAIRRNQRGSLKFVDDDANVRVANVSTIEIEAGPE